jgi:tRNA threonylcarbamoyladenosine biosynthesis protein TsaB
MLILGVDTSGKNGSIALVEFLAGSPRTLEIRPLEGGTFSAQLIPQIGALLVKHHLTKPELDGFAVASGPGSFTGLRVGLAAIKALGEILSKPIAAVSLFEATARAAGYPGSVVVGLDAGHGQVYAGLYGFENGHSSCLDQRLLSLVEFRSEFGAQPVVTSSPLLSREIPGSTLIAQPKADVIADLGFEKIQRGELVTPETLDASYVRASDAEIRRFKGEKP